MRCNIFIGIWALSVIRNNLTYAVNSTIFMRCLWHADIIAADVRTLYVCVNEDTTTLSSSNLWYGTMRAEREKIQFILGRVSMSTIRKFNYWQYRIEWRRFHLTLTFTICLLFCSFCFSNGNLLCSVGRAVCLFAVCLCSDRNSHHYRLSVNKNARAAAAAAALSWARLAPFEHVGVNFAGGRTTGPTE